MEPTPKRKVQVVVFNTNGAPSLLLLLTNARRGNFWQNITGGVEEGESYEQAAVRELVEETQIKVSIDELITLECEYEFVDQWNNQVTEKCFLIKTEIDQVKIDPSEHVEYEWRPVEEVTEANFKFPSNHEAFTFAKAKL